jgi:predicted AlkP superfamily pyrophosphatase or phosphodiesterase
MGISTRADEPVVNAEKPRLIVLVVFDQMRGDYLIRWEPHFSEGGFRRLFKEGAWFQNCHYSYAATLTGAGHASILTGCNPARHGIVANEWYDVATGTSVNCTESIKFDRVPPLAANEDRASKKDRGNVSPDLMLAESFGDVLKEQTKNESRIVSISFKDRSAVLPAGRKPDACYWFDGVSGMFVTSTYYHPKLHSWVETFNRERVADQWFNKDWSRFRPELNYDVVVGPDDMKGEGGGSKQGRTFPHPTTGGLDKPGKAYYDALYNSPFGNELLLALVKRAVDGEKLGRDAVPDLLCVSFSSNDAIGHTWGPDSHEVFDVTLRSDAILKELLSYLDSTVGKGRYVLAITADHGICPIPEVTLARGKYAGRIPTAELQRRANEYLEASFGTGTDDQQQWIAAITNKWITFNRMKLREQHVEISAAEHGLAEWLQKLHGISAVYTASQLKHGIAKDDIQGERVNRSYYSDRCGDVLVIPSPNWLLTDDTTGTTHGSPFGYDSHVPLLVFGPKITTGVRKERVSPTSIAAIFAHAVGVRIPKDADAVLPELLFVTGDQ